MSAVFDAATKLLTVSLATGADRTKHKMFVVWFKWATGQSHNSANVLGEVLSSGGTLHRLLSNTTPVLAARITGNVLGDTAYDTSPYIWQLGGAYFGPDAISTDGRPYLDGGVNRSASANTGDASGNATDYTEVCFGGQTTSNNNYTRWKGKLAEGCLLEASSESDLADMFLELYTKKATAITVPSGAAIRGYWPMLDSVSADTYGSDLTNSGTTTFDDTDHPSLSGGGGGGMTRPLILPWRHVG